MGWKSTIGRLVGGALLAVAALAVLFVVAMLAASVLWGLTTARFAGIWFGSGLAMTAGLFGYLVRKRAAGQVLPVEYDISVAFRGGQGGM